MEEFNPYQDKLLQPLRRKLIPGAEEKTLRLVLVQPPFLVPSDVRVTPVKAPLLKSKTNSPGVMTKWPSEAMNATPYVTLCCVVEGDVDWNVAVTRRMTQVFPQLDARHGRYILRVPSQSVLVMPPGVPFGDGTQPHWHSDPAELPDSLLFWISCTPQGADLHMCRTRNGVHESLYPAFVIDDHLLRVAELLRDDLQKSAPRLSHTAHHYLSVILLRVTEALRSSKKSSTMRAIVPPLSAQANRAGGGVLGEALLVERACRFIETRLVTPLTVQQIADHLYVSQSYLNRLFRHELGVSPMKYVTQRRMEIARSLLVDTKYSILYISDFFGYSHPDVFSRAFKEHFGDSPTKFRRNLQSEERNN